MNDTPNGDLTVAQVLERLKEAEEKVRVCEERYRAAFEYTGTAMMVVEEDTTISMANHKLEELTGHPQEEGMDRRWSWTQFVAPEDLPTLMQYHIKRRQDPSSVPGEYEFRLRHRNGGLRDILMNVSLIPGSKKTLISLIDITKRKTAERALAESEAKFRELFENANDIVYTHDLQGNFTSSNVVAHRTYGYSAEEMLGLNINRIVDERYLEVAQSHLREKVDGKASTAPYELLTRTKSGDDVWIEVSTRIVFDAAGRPAGVQGIGRNITDRKKAELDFEESERRFAETADLLPSVIADLDFDMRVTYVNKLGTELFGYTMDDLKNGISVEQILAPEDVARARTDIANVLTPGNYTYGKFNEFRARRKDGTELEILSNASPLVKGRKVCGIRICLIDITERKRTQEQLRRSEEKFRSIFAHSPAGIALCDARGALTDMNDAFAALFQIPSGDRKFPLSAHLNMAEEEWRAVVEGRPAHRETQIDLKGRLRYLDWRIAGLGPAGAKAADAVLVQVHDVTEQRVAQELKLSRANEAAEKANRMVEGLRKEIAGKSKFHTMVSRSPRMQEIFDLLPEMAQTSATVLITGESGTGKELIARSLHDLGSRASKPFVAINCGALPDNLLESELFGYKAGAFTDAKKDKLGKFAVAQNGTIFLDEIGDISPALQVKLLRVLQERVFEPLGGVGSVKSEARVIAATNKDLAAMVKAGQFREDLFYRLRVLTVKLPSLRERRCDIPVLCDHFIAAFNARYRKEIKGITDEALESLLAYSFPGNIRELENLIEHAFIFCKCDMIDARHLPGEITGTSHGAPSASGGASEFDEARTLDDVERIFLKRTIADCGGSKLKTAQRLGIHKTTLFRKLRQLGMGD